MKLFRNLRAENVSYRCDIENSFEEKVKVFNENVHTNFLRLTYLLQNAVIQGEIGRIEVTFKGDEDNFYATFIEIEPNDDCTLVIRLLDKGYNIKYSASITVDVNTNLVRFRCYPKDVSAVSKIAETALLELFDEHLKRIEELEKPLFNSNTLEKVSVKEYKD